MDDVPLLRSARYYDLTIISLAHRTCETWRLFYVSPTPQHASSFPSLRAPCLGMLPFQSRAASFFAAYTLNLGATPPELS